MKKSLIIIFLCVLQAACATRPVAADSGPTLLSYSDLASEITVGYRDISTDEPAANHRDEAADTP